jgi:hypothetical protein
MSRKAKILIGIFLALVLLTVVVIKTGLIARLFHYRFGDTPIIIKIYDEGDPGVTHVHTEIPSHYPLVTGTNNQFQSNNWFERITMLTTHDVITGKCLEGHDFQQDFAIPYTIIFEITQKGNVSKLTVSDVNWFLGTKGISIDTSDIPIDCADCTLTAIRCQDGSGNSYNCISPTYIGKGYEYHIHNAHDASVLTNCNSMYP